VGTITFKRGDKINAAVDQRAAELDRRVTELLTPVVEWPAWTTKR
jgi:hypothetical protein